MAQNDQIEDVLSSVRRLVSSENGPATRRTKRDAAAIRAPILLLGPSCRVTEVEDPFQMIRSLAQEEQDARDARHLFEAQMKDAEPDALATAVGDVVVEPDAIKDLATRIGGDEALRDLIAETVRAELSGELGDRITGSVRKLVRHELLRMLTADTDD